MTKSSGTGGAFMVDEDKTINGLVTVVFKVLHGSVNWDFHPIPFFNGRGESFIDVAQEMTARVGFHRGASVEAPVTAEPGGVLLYTVLHPVISFTTPLKHLGYCSSAGILPHQRWAICVTNVMRAADVGRCGGLAVGDCRGRREDSRRMWGTRCQHGGGVAREEVVMLTTELYPLSEVERKAACRVRDVQGHRRIHLSPHRHVAVELQPAEGVEKACVDRLWMRVALVNLLVVGEVPVQQLGRVTRARLFADKILVTLPPARGGLVMVLSTRHFSDRVESGVQFGGERGLFG